jgi:hypothetical protein
MFRCLMIMNMISLRLEDLFNSLFISCVGFLVCVLHVVLYNCWYSTREEVLSHVVEEDSRVI